ncbi:MAG: class I SAM-dependent methyltransferase [Rhodospirillales bacterium]|nr:class I SAM-dependent methyltransferase [Saprospiraceae bacterium]MCB1681041.1 class I SAM-dependent methyltransferase [Alphaproteobacteria bacterium]MCB9976625.1 class I SAM-dependent methyltransferase [Rhodospirillales bacterium]
MSQIDPSTFFDAKIAEQYDSRTERMNAVVENLHALIGLVLEDLPDNARILCVGAGTGTEIVRLAGLHPNWQFVALEPSGDMMEKCRSKLKKQGIVPRCDFIQGYLSDIAPDETFDAVLCLLVTQFVLDSKQRQAMFDSMASHLRLGGYLINAEISCDMQSTESNEMMKKWIAAQNKTTASAEEAAKSIAMMKQHVAILPSANIEAMLRKSGFGMPMLFFQSLLIHAWYSKK